jgi:response regulator RpfG family c-di-GMP phosphodiesterase
MDSRRWRRANVLAVDDQPANLVAVDAVLSEDFNVIRASSGEQALALVQSRPDIDVILMDVQMPHMDGFQAAQAIKQIPGCRDIPIVFITAVYHEDPFVKQGYQVGAVDYFSKPFDPQILRAKVGIYAAFRQKADLEREWERQIEASEALLDAGRKFAGMLEHLPLGVIMDAAGRMVSTNLEASERESLKSVLAKGENVCETCEVRGADGKTRALLCTSSSLRGEDGVACGHVLIVRDVTERNRLAEDLEKRIGRLAAVNAGTAATGERATR